MLPLERTFHKDLATDYHLFFFNKFIYNMQHLHLHLHIATKKGKKITKLYLKMQLLHNVK